MTSVSLGKTLEYIKIHETLRPEKLLIDYYLCKGILLCFSLPWKILYKHKIKHIIQLTKVAVTSVS